MYIHLLYPLSKRRKKNQECISTTFKRRKKDIQHLGLLLALDTRPP